MTAPRKKSPSAPSMPLDEAIAGALEIYRKEQRHPAPTDAVARDLGYKSANNGAALSALATLRHYGLLERPEPGMLAASSDVQAYAYAPDEQFKKELQIKWLRSPPLFAELLDKYEGGLPSDTTIQYDLIKEGFKPGTAEATLKVFRQSVEFVNFYERSTATSYAPPAHRVPEQEDAARPRDFKPAPATVAEVQTDLANGLDRIPVRLDSKRRAWLEIPTPFYQEDKERLKAQIDLLITDEKDAEPE